MAALGVVPVDAGGINKVVGVAVAFRALGFPTAILRDDDRGTPVGEAEFLSSGGIVFHWEPGHATEDALFTHLPESAAQKLLEHAVAALGEPTVNAQLDSASSGIIHADDCRGALAATHRQVLGKAAQSKTTPWFKSVGRMEQVAREVIGPVLPATGAPVADVVKELRTWARNAAG